MKIEYSKEDNLLSDLNDEDFETDIQEMNSSLQQVETIEIKNFTWEKADQLKEEFEELECGLLDQAK